MCMLATVSYGQDTSHPGEFKVDGLWPATITISYTPQEICRIPVYIKVGMFIQIENCKNKKIVMDQVNCTGNHGFPCYAGCVELKIRANFEALLTLKKYRVQNSLIPSDGNWKAYFTDDGGATTSDTWTVTGDGNPNVVQLCVEAWDANIYGAAPGTETYVGDIAILAVPTATPDYCDYCP